MFTVGLATPLLGFFMISSMIIAVPTGIKILNWLATTWRGNLIFDTPMLFALGFIALFTIGGLSGIFLATFPIDWQAQDTYFVVAHLHYVLFGGSMFGIFAGLYYWWPKMFGRKLDETLGKLALLAALHRLQPRVLPAAPARARRDAAADLHVQPRVLGDGQPDLDDRLLRDGGRDPRLRRERDLDEAARGRPGRERPVARRHARVVHDLAAAAAQLRQGSVRDERAAAAGPAPADSRRGAYEARPLASADSARRGGRDARRGRLRHGRARSTGHQVLAALALPPLAAVVAAAWIELPAAAPVGLTALGAVRPRRGGHGARSSTSPSRPCAFAATLVS